MAKTAKKKTAKGCKCVEQVNEKLKERGYKLVQLVEIDFATMKSGMTGPVLDLEKLGSGKAKKRPSVVCTCCPFCGRKLYG